MEAVGHEVWSMVLPLKFLKKKMGSGMLLLLLQGLVHLRPLIP